MNSKLKCKWKHYYWEIVYNPRQPDDDEIYWLNHELLERNYTHWSHTIHTLMVVRCILLVCCVIINYYLWNINYGALILERPPSRITEPPTPFAQARKKCEKICYYILRLGTSAPATPLWKNTTPSDPRGPWLTVCVYDLSQISNYQVQVSYIIVMQ